MPIHLTLRLEGHLWVSARGRLVDGRGVLVAIVTLQLQRLDTLELALLGRTRVQMVANALTPSRSLLHLIVEAGTTGLQLAAGRAVHAVHLRERCFVEEGFLGGHA